MQNKETCLAVLRAKAQQLLAQREHGQQELIQKLMLKHATCQAWVEEVVAALIDSDWLNEWRYVEAFIRKEIRLGHGPKHISAALKQKQVSSELIQQGLDAAEVNWFELAQQVYLKKYHQPMGYDLKEKAKRQQFLIYRGFDMDTVRLVMEAND